MTAMTFGRNDLYNLAIRAINMAPESTDRIWRAVAIVEAGDAVIIDDSFAMVRSQADTTTTYLVERIAGCPCPDHTYRKVVCKHEWALDLLQVLQAKAAARKAA